MITIDAARCNGCGACLEICPTGALYLVDGKAALDASLCRDCEACLGACPNEAIGFVTQEAPAATTMRVPALRPEPDVLRVSAEPVAVPFREKVLPVVATALAWTGREILPRLVDVMLDALDRRTTAPETMSAGPAPARQPPAQAKGGAGRRRRHRHRGG